MGLKPGEGGRDVVARFGVPVLVATWYACSVVGNNAGKVVLPLFPYPYTLSLMQFGIGFAVTPVALWLKGRSTRHLGPLVARSLNKGLLLGVTGIGSNLFHRIALVYISVSFEHTVKATQPLFSGACGLPPHATQAGSDVYLGCGTAIITTAPCNGTPALGFSSSSKHPASHIHISTFRPSFSSPRAHTTPQPPCRG